MTACRHSLVRTSVRVVLSPGLARGSTLMTLRSRCGRAGGRAARGEGGSGEAARRRGRGAVRGERRGVRGARSLARLARGRCAPARLVLEEHAGLAVGDDGEVRTGIARARLRVPVEVGEVGGPRQHLEAALEVRRPVLGLEAVREVDVAADLLALGVHVAHEDDAGQLAVAHELLARRQRLQEGPVGQRLAHAGQRLGRRLLVQVLLLVRLLARLELVALERVARAAVAQLDELARDVLRLEVEVVRLADLRLEVVLVRREGRDLVAHREAVVRHGGRRGGARARARSGAGRARTHARRANAHAHATHAQTRRGAAPPAGDDY